MNDDIYSGDLDPDIAELMGISAQDDSTEKPDFSDLFEDKKAGQKDSAPSREELSKEAFDPIEIFESPSPNPIFSDKNYYQIALNGEGEAAKKTHTSLSQFLNVQDPKERADYRNKLIHAYWQLAGNIARKIHTKLEAPKKYLLRYGYLLPTTINKELREMIGSIIEENKTGEPVHYVDEWLKKIASGEVGASAQDEVKHAQINKNQQLNLQLEKIQGNLNAQIGLMNGKIVEIENIETFLKEKTDSLTSKTVNSSLNIKEPYSPTQRSALTEILTLTKQLLNLDRELNLIYQEIHKIKEQLEQLEEKIADTGQKMVVDTKTIDNEFNTVRQMAKMCVGKQGNHIPFLMKQYLRPNIKEIGTRENIITILAQVEAFDPGVFKRTYKRQTNRIVPHVILMPCYGDKGICWEPFEKFNRAAGRGRIAIPMYPKDLKTAVIYALGDLRWQVAKEKAQHYWMEEGLTGHYYQWFVGRKMRGDVKDFFIQDYYLWITKESEGTQKIDREVRGVFWRNMPFPQELRDDLRKRGFVYNELYKKDINRSMSDGY